MRRKTARRSAILSGAGMGGMNGLVPTQVGERASTASYGRGGRWGGGHLSISATTSPGL